MAKEAKVKVLHQDKETLCKILEVDVIGKKNTNTNKNHQSILHKPPNTHKNKHQPTRRNIQNPRQEKTKQISKRHR